MKVTKYILIAASVVATLTVITWLLRDTLIQRISNPLLQEYGIAVTDVSLDALATHDATIGFLELVHDNGTTIAIENLTLPIGATSTGLKTYTAKRVSVITATTNDAEPLELALLIDQFLSLTGNLGGSAIIIAELNLPPYPVVYDLQWVLTDDVQKLLATIESVAVSASVTRTDATNHALAFSLPTVPASSPEHSITANLQQGDQIISLSGSATLNLPAWGSLAKLSGVIPREIEIESGIAALRFDIEIPYDTSRSPSMTADLSPSSPLQLKYDDTEGAIASIIVESGSPVELAATFPEVEWSLQQAQSSLLVTYGEWQEIPLSISELACQSGPACSMNTRVVMGAAELPIGKAGRFELSSAQNIALPEQGLRIDVLPNATLEVTGLATPDTEIDLVSIRLVSTATLELVDAGWHLAADSLDANIEAMSLSADLSVTTPLFVENLLVRELDQVLSAESDVYTPMSRAGWNGQVIDLPGFRGEVSWQGADLAINLRTIGLHQNGAVGAQHNIDTRAGQLSIGEVAVSFGAQKLSHRISPWRGNGDLSAGSVFAELQASWTPTDSGLDIDAQTSARIENLSGNYIDTVVVGLSTTLNTIYDSATGFAAEPSSFTVALIEVGLPIENISASYVLYPNVLAFDMQGLRMTAFGGTIHADPFSFHTDRDSNTVILRAESVELDALLTLKEFEAIEVNGSIGAELPVTIAGDVITIENGTLTGEPPGGIIRYLPGLDPDAADTSSLGLVTRTLSNFEYETLTSEVDYSTGGDLKLQLHLTGRNPDLDENRPVVLNLGVENNIPQMLRSLRAARAVEDILEKRLQGQTP